MSASFRKYERLAEKSALRRKILEREIAEKYDRSSLINNGGYVKNGEVT